MSAKSYAYLRVVILCLLITSCVVLYATTEYRSGLHAPFAIALVATFLFCCYAVFKPPPRGLPGADSSPLWYGLVLVCGGIPLIIMAWPACESVWDAQARRGLVDRLNQIGLAMHAYHDREHDLPPSAIYGKDGKPLLSWRVALLPYLGPRGLVSTIQTR
jgi:hypothetical protein